MLARYLTARVTDDFSMTMCGPTEYDLETNDCLRSGKRRRLFDSVLYFYSIRDSALSGDASRV
jgi:hypothetical protein